MKFAILSCLLVFSVAFVISKPQRLHGRGCRHFFGQCVEECPVGTHVYPMGIHCASPTLTEGTCTEPLVKILPETTCDLSRCDCDEPNVKDETTGKCVKVEDCPKAAEGKDTN